eukprot:1547515-Rhodomonas_salina.1
MPSHYQTLSRAQWRVELGRLQCQSSGLDPRSCAALGPLDRDAARVVVEPVGRNGRRGKGACGASDCRGVALRHTSWRGRLMVAWRVPRDPAGRPEGWARQITRGQVSLRS